MTATQPTARTRKTSTIRRRRRPLPRITFAGAAATLLVLLGAAKTWPVATGIILGLIVGTAILTVVRPRRMASLWQLLDRLPDRPPGLPAHGHRTVGWFLALNATQFEHAIAALCTEHDTVHQAHVVGGANDRGADVLVDLKDGRRIMIQCKRYQPRTNVSSGDIQKTNGTYRDIHRCHSAAIVTTSGFTRDAIDTNARLHHRIRLIDGHALVQWANGGHAPW